MSSFPRRDRVSHLCWLTRGDCQALPGSLPRIALGHFPGDWWGSRPSGSWALLPDAQCFANLAPCERAHLIPVTSPQYKNVFCDDLTCSMLLPKAGNAVAGAERTVPAEAQPLSHQMVEKHVRNPALRVAGR